MKCLIPALILSVWCAGCASTKYKTWQGGGVRTGPGGACESVEGVEVWSYGSPNRPHEITGLIEDERPAGPIPMAMRMKTVARKAKAAGADGVIVIGDGKEYVGSVNTMNAFSTLNASTTGTANTQFYPGQAHTNYNGRTSGTMNTFGTGISAPMFRAHGTYQAFRYVR